jgi:exopolysaccharide biosynthesis WecB/TagA/CpsF family protein
MRDSGKKNILGVWVDAVDYEAAVSRVLSAARMKNGMAVSALAVHGVMTGVLDKVHRYRLNQFDLIVPDGQPVRWALNLLHRAKLQDRVYGPTLMIEVCAKAAAESLPIYLYGSRPDVLASLRRNLTTRFPTLRIAGSQPSRFRRLSAEEKSEVVEEIRSSGAAITFVGLGCPRQEVWAYEFNRELNMPVIAVGAAFDFHAGTQSQAPAALQRRGLEWLYRLLHEPRRLWRRYLFLNPTYLVLLALQAARLWQINPATAIPPTADISYG